MVVLKLLAFLTGRLHSFLLLVHLLHLRLDAMFENLNLMLERENGLILTLKCHLKSHHFVLNVVSLRLK